MGVAQWSQVSSNERTQDQPRNGSRSSDSQLWEKGVQSNMKGMHWWVDSNLFADDIMTIP